MLPVCYPLWLGVLGASLIGGCTQMPTAAPPGSAVHIERVGPSGQSIRTIEVHAEHRLGLEQITRAARELQTKMQQAKTPEEHRALMEAFDKTLRESLPAGDARAAITREIRIHRPMPGASAPQPGPGHAQSPMQHGQGMGMGAADTARLLRLLERHMEAMQTLLKQLAERLPAATAK